MDYGWQIRDVLNDIHSDVFAILTALQDEELAQAEDLCRELLEKLG